MYVCVLSFILSDNNFQISHDYQLLDPNIGNQEFNT